jgi:hypothetical protein
MATASFVSGLGEERQTDRAGWGMASAKLGIWGAEGIVWQWARSMRVVRPRDLAEADIPHTWLYVVGGLKMQRVGPGLYVRHGDEVDPLILMARKYPGLTLGLTSALWAHGLVTERPANDWFVMGHKDRRPTLPVPAARFVRSSWAKEDREEVALLETRIQVHSPVRALLECVRFERVLGRESVAKLVRDGLRAG